MRKYYNRVLGEEHNGNIVPIQEFKYPYTFMWNKVTEVLLSGKYKTIWIECYVKELDSWVRFKSE